MADKKSQLNEVKSLINSVLISVKGLLTLGQLRRDYISVIGEEIPYKKFGYHDLRTFLETLHETVRVIRQDNEYYVKPVVGKEVEHIAKLVCEQKEAKKKPAPWRQPNRKPYSSQWVPPSSSGYRTSYRPAKVYQHPNSRYSEANRARPNVSQCRGATRPPPRPQFSGNRDLGSSSEWLHDKYERGPPRSCFNTRPNATPRSAVPPSFTKPTPSSDLPKLRSSPVEEKQPPSPPSPVYSSAKEKLQAEAGRLNIPLSQFISIKAGKKKPYWISKVTLKDTSYSTYPKEIQSKEAAEEEAATDALKGLEKLKIKDNVTTTSDFKIALRRVTEIVHDTEAGIWFDALKSLYRTKYNEKLSATFLETCTAQTLDEIEFFSPDSIHWIAQKATDSSALNRVPDIPVVDEYDGMWPELELPKEKHWDVHVTYIKDCSSISIRLIGKKYHEEFEDVMNNMELYYIDKKNQIVEDNVVEGDFCACYSDESWFRICVEKIQGKSAVVNFVDHGDSDTVPLTSLYKLTKEFQQLPIQSIPCTLAGLDMGFQNADILNELQSLVLGRSLVAEVLTQDPDICIVLYDTSTEEDININERLLQILPKSFTKPKLPIVGGICEAYVTHAEQNGDIFLTFDSDTYRILEALLDDAESKIKTDNPIQDVIDVDKIYLSKYSRDEEWNRTAPLSANLETNEVLMRFVDIGASETVSSAAIIPLDDFSPILCKIPYQAIKCRLSNVPSSGDMEWTEATVKRLYQLLPDVEPLLLKVQMEESGEQLPEVELFKRLQPQNELVSINATLTHDSVLFKKKEKINGDKPKRIALRRDTDAMPLPRPYLPALLQYFDVHVCYAASPHHFGVQNLDHKDDFKNLMRDIQCHYNSKNYVFVPNIKPGNIYIAQHENHMWYRVKVSHCTGVTVTGLKIDFGDIICTTSDKVQPLLPKFRILPSQGYRAAMGGITPLNKDWNPEDCLRFRELVEGKKFVTVVLSVTAERDSLPFLELKLIDTNGKIDISLDELFIKEGRAFKYDSRSRV